MKKDVRVSVIQTFVPKSRVEGERQIDRLLKEATRLPVDMVGLPEDCVATYQEIVSGYDALRFLSGIAKKYKVYIFGATAVLEKDGLHNRGFFFNREGEIVTYHDKVVLTPGEEKAGMVAGKTIEVFDTEFGKMAILVCKDSFHRYSAWFFDSLKKAGVEIVLIPSYSLNVSKRSVEIWVDSLKALAKWFDVYVVAPGTIGQNATEYPSFGHALIICPSRVVLAEGSLDKEEILRATLDVKSLENIRNSFSSKSQPGNVPPVRMITNSAT